MYEFLLTTRDYTQNGPYDFVMLDHRQHDLGFANKNICQDVRGIEKTISNLTNLNADLAAILSGIENKCSYFPKGGI